MEKTYEASRSSMNPAIDRRLFLKGGLYLLLVGGCAVPAVLASGKSQQEGVPVDVDEKVMYFTAHPERLLIPGKEIAIPSFTNEFGYGGVYEKHVADTLMFKSLRDSGRLLPQGQIRERPMQGGIVQTAFSRLPKNGSVRKVADIGAGSGNAYSQLYLITDVARKAGEKVEIYSVDIDPDSINYQNWMFSLLLPKERKQELRLVQDISDNVCLPVDNLDALTANMLHWGMVENFCEATDKFAQSMRSSMKKGGLLLVTDRLHYHDEQGKYVYDKTQGKRTADYLSSVADFRVNAVIPLLGGNIQRVRDLEGTIAKLLRAPEPDEELIEALREEASTLKKDLKPETFCVELEAA